MDSNRLKRRVDGRDQARAIIGLDLLTLDHPDKVDGFIDQLNRTFIPKLIEEKKADRQRTIRELSVVTIDFGVHSGKQLDEIPREYLSWLLESSEKTCENIRDYLELTEDRGSPDHVGGFEIEDGE